MELKDFNKDIKNRLSEEETQEIYKKIFSENNDILLRNAKTAPESLLAIFDILFEKYSEINDEFNKDEKNHNLTDYGRQVLLSQLEILMEIIEEIRDEVSFATKNKLIHDCLKEIDSKLE